MIEPAKNYAVGVLGISISLVDITNMAQAIGAVCGALLVAIQLYKQLKK